MIYSEMKITAIPSAGQHETLQMSWVIRIQCLNGKLVSCLIVALNVTP